MQLSECARRSCGAESVRFEAVLCPGKEQNHAFVIAASNVKMMMV